MTLGTITVEDIPLISDIPGAIPEPGTAGVVAAALILVCFGLSPRPRKN